MKLKSTFFSKWTLMRLFRLSMGIIALGQGIWTGEMLIGIAGGFLIFMALGNLGCCSVNNCGLRTSGRELPGDEDISFEVVNQEYKKDGKKDIRASQ